MKNISVVLDNIKIIVKSEYKTIFQLINHLYTSVSHFCYNKKLIIAGNCRMRFVEVSNIPKFIVLKSKVKNVNELLKNYKTAIQFICCVLLYCQYTVKFNIFKIGLFILVLFVLYFFALTAPLNIKKNQNGIFFMKKVIYIYTLVLMFYFQIPRAILFTCILFFFLDNLSLKDDFLKKSIMYIIDALGLKVVFAQGFKQGQQFFDHNPNTWYSLAGLFFLTTATTSGLVANEAYYQSQIDSLKLSAEHTKILMDHYEKGTPEYFLYEKEWVFYTQKLIKNNELWTPLNETKRICKDLNDKAINFPSVVADIVRKR